MNSHDSERYANLVIDVLNLQPGQNLLIRTEQAHAELAAAIGRAAYDRGARYVEADVSIPALYKNRIESSKSEYLDYLPSYAPNVNKTIVDETWALVSIKNPGDPDFLADLDADRNARVSRAVANSREVLRQSLQADRQQWIVIAHPTEAWAAKVLGTQPSAEALEELWGRMKPILRLDTDDPAAAWWTHSEAIQRRADALQDLALRKLRFQAEGTDLEVGIPQGAIWAGGSAERPDGLRFLPNLPTEEVFTTPHLAETKGTVRVTRPALVLQNVVEDAWFRFDGGRVVDFGARIGRDILARYVDIDEGARRLGEIALVDGTSPIFLSDTVFFNTLFDENAACHFALGSSYSACMAGGADMSKDQLRDAGGNTSLVHTDFMLGTPDIRVVGTTGSGEQVEIISEGAFVL
ncbi:MAG: aminopeptidase [Spirochaetes bacterium]|jgi:aminopeptidase|nr:aminopeptidase [Spirochaetota bacterium]